MIKCPICAALREKSALAWAEEIALEDDLAMTPKADPTFVVKRKALQRARARADEFLKQEDAHRRHGHMEHKESEED